MPINSTISIQRILQITEDADQFYKDWYTDPSSMPVVGSFNARNSGKFSAAGSQAPVTLGFGNVTTVAGWIIEASGPFQLMCNGGISVPGGYVQNYAPISPGSVCFAGPNDCSVTSLQVVAIANTPIYGRYCVWGTT